MRAKKNKAQQGKCVRKKLGHSRVSEKQDNSTSDARKKKIRAQQGKCEKNKKGHSRVSVKKNKDTAE